MDVDILNLMDDQWTSRRPVLVKPQVPSPVKKSPTVKAEAAPPMAPRLSEDSFQSQKSQLEERPPIPPEPRTAESTAVTTTEISPLSSGKFPKEDMSGATQVRATVPIGRVQSEEGLGPTPPVVTALLLLLMPLWLPVLGFLLLPLVFTWVSIAGISIFTTGVLGALSRWYSIAQSLTKTHIT